jgi:thiol:disulfide interchange protein
MTMTMFSLRFCSFVAVLLAVVPVAGATKTPMVSPGVAMAAPVGACPSKQQQRSDMAAAPSIFGVSRQLPALISMRGGQVFEPTSLEDVEAILLKAGSEQKLVVIDFSATWCVIRYDYNNRTV